MKILLEHPDIDINKESIISRSTRESESYHPVLLAFEKGYDEIIELLINNEKYKYEINRSNINHIIHCQLAALDEDIEMTDYFLYRKLMIPSFATSIAKETFFGCAKLKNILISPSVSSIGESCFSRCISLTKISIPSSTKTIEKWVFYGCKSLKSVDIPSSITTIENYSFADTV